MRRHKREPGAKRPHSTRPSSHPYAEYLDKLPTGVDSLRALDEEFNRLYEEEITRSDVWTNKGIALLGASGLVLSLASMALPCTRLPTELCDPWQPILFLLLRQVPFVVALGSFFLSSPLSLKSLKAGNIQRFDPDSLVELASESEAEFLRLRAAMRRSMYENNVDFVNAKATQVNKAREWFFRGCVAEAIFAVSLVIWAAR